MASKNYAGFWIRLLAYIVDAVLIWVIVSILLAILGQSAADVVQAVVGIGYLIGFWTWKSATPGKMLFKLTIVDEKGKPLQLKTAVIRFLGYAVSSVVLGLGFLWIAFDKEKQGWHDKIAKTHVVKM